MSSKTPPRVQTNVALAPYTTIFLGGPAKYFINCDTLSALHFSLAYAQQHRLRLHILGGGSNTIFADAGFDGLVLKLALLGTTFVTRRKITVVTAAAGEAWDDLVAATVKHGLSGLENMSGIPGTVGAAPVQNIGAYGQDVSQVICAVTAIDRTTQQLVTFNKPQCKFAYRASRFKADQQRFIITQVSFRLTNQGQPRITYPDVLAEIGGEDALLSYGRGAPALTRLRQAVLDVRRRKAMLIDPRNPHTRSCGSFFVNPILSKKKHQELQKKTGQLIPARPNGRQLTIPAAWLIEQAGYPKGFRRHGVGISNQHNLALVNYGGTTTSLLSLAHEIQAQVKKKFDLLLAIEPIII